MATTVSAKPSRGNRGRSKRITTNKPIAITNSSKQEISQSLNRRWSDLSDNIKIDTPLGWITFLSSVTSAILLHEIRLQRKLTCPPLVYTQNTKMMNKLREYLSHNPKATDGKGILTRDIKPSLLVGTRGVLASTAAYALHGPPRERHLHFREIMTMSDGATIALDWEVPHPKYDSSVHVRLGDSQVKANVLYGPIDLPVVIIMHGINNDTGFGYMKSLMRSCADKGWIACGMNFRGCGGQKLTTPRGYNAAYTGDLRGVVEKISARLKHQDRTPVFLVGFSLGANIMVKFMGEEGFSRTLPSCIQGAISLGNPLHINSANVPFPYNMLLGAGVKKSLLQSWSAVRDMSSCFHFGGAVRQALLSRTIGELDNVMSPFLIRNENTYPFSASVGYKDGEEYWHDASSNRYIQHVTVPLLKLSSQDDALVVDGALRSLSRCLENPNVLMVKTKCGGHLGWQEASPHGFGFGKSWADAATTDFIEAVLEMKSKDHRDDGVTAAKKPGSVDIVESMYASKNLQSKL